MTYPSHSSTFLTIVNTLAVRADELIRRVQYHSDNGKLNEQFNRNLGFMQGASDVTWTYAAVLSAHVVRNKIQ